MTTVGVVGASGYSGAVLTGILAGHPQVRLAFATSDKLAGQAVSAHVRDVSGRLSGLVFKPNAESAELANSVDVTFLATSAEVSCALAPQLIKHTVVIDLSGGFRLGNPQDHERFYKFPHPNSELLASAHYGLPELLGAPKPGTRLIANPGCYPTSAILALAPLVSAGLIENSHVIVDAKSGTTGAGKQAKEEYSFSEAADDFRAYKILSHQHTPEIERFAKAKLTFTAHLLPIRRGILSTIYARKTVGTTQAQLECCLRDAYSGRPFVRVLHPHDVRIANVAMTNHCDLGVLSDDETVVMVSAIDNLVKGAAGQAVQNLNLLLGWDETLGLAGLQRA